MSNGNNGPGVLVAIIVTALLAVYTASSIILGGGNQLADFFFYIMVGGGVLGVIAPKISFWVFLLQCAYLDLLKRLLIIGGSVEMIDLFWVLGVAPVTMVGIVLGLVSRGLFGKFDAEVGDVRRLIAAVALNVLLAAYTFLKGGGIGGTLRVVANGSCYAVLLFVIPILFRTPTEIVGCVRKLIFIFLPVAIYGVYQQAFGFLPFEIDYLKTGLSIEIKQLESDRVRAFSTLNSPPSLSVVCCSLAALVAAISFSRAKDLGKGFSPPMALMAMFIFIAGWVASTARSGIIMLPVAILGTVLFQNRRGVKWFYGVTIGVFLLLVILAPWIYANIFVWTDDLISMTGGGQFVRNLVNMNSYVDRLQGFVNVLANPQAYSWFGIGGVDERDSSFYNHDPVSDALLSYGVVGLGLGVIVCGFLLWRLHGIVLEMRSPVMRALAAASLANAAGNVAVSMINGNLLGVYPINVFFWGCISFAVALRRNDDMAVSEAKARRLAEEQAEMPQVAVHPVPVGRNPGRFAPVPRALQS